MNEASHNSLLKAWFAFSRCSQFPYRLVGSSRLDPMSYLDKEVWTRSREYSGGTKVSDNLLSDPSVPPLNLYRILEQAIEKVYYNILLQLMMCWNSPPGHTSPGKPSTSLQHSYCWITAAPLHTGGTRGRGRASPLHQWQPPSSVVAASLTAAPTASSPSMRHRFK